MAIVPIGQEQPTTPIIQTDVQKSAEKVQPTQSGEQIQQAKVAEMSKPVITWSPGGYGSGTSRTLYKDGRPYGTIQIPESYKGRDEEYIQGQYNRYGYITPSQTTPEIQHQMAVQADIKAEAEHARVEAHREEQEFMKGSFMGREAQARVYGGTPSAPVVGIQAFKQAELKAAQERAGIQPITPGIKEFKASEAEVAGAKQLIGKIEQREGIPFSQVDYSKLSQAEIQKLVKTGYLRIPEEKPTISPISEFERSLKPPTREQIDYTGKTIGEFGVEGEKLPSITDFGLTRPPSLYSTPEAMRIAEEKIYAGREKESFTTPLLKWTQKTSKELQTEADKLIGVTKETVPGVRTAVSGAAGVFTGLPEFVGQTAFAGEQIVRHPSEVVAIATVGVPLFLKQTKEVAVQDPLSY